MNKTIEKNQKTLQNLKRSMIYAINQDSKYYRYKIMHAAFKRYEEIMYNRRK